MRPEIEFLLSCIESRSGPGTPSPIIRRVDWDRFISLCDWHNLTRHVCGVLSSHDPDIPSDVIRRLHVLNRTHAARSLFLASELSRILKNFESSGVRAYPFKGPALSLMLYGDPACRQSKDLDLLIPAELIRPALKILRNSGYNSAPDLEGARLASHRRTEYEIGLVRDDGKVQLELQWAIAPAYFGFDHEKLRIWSALQNRSWSGLNFPLLPPEETLVLLAIHGAKHRWCKLGWICDVAALLESRTPPNLSRAFKLAGGCHAKRLLSLALLLSEDIAGTFLPENVSDLIRSDLMVSSLARQTRDLIAGTPLNPDVDPGKYLYYFKSRDGRRDQLTFALRLAGTLAAGEWNPFGIPEALAPVAIPFRPLHMAGRYGEPILRALARK